MPRRPKRWPKHISKGEREHGLHRLPKPVRNAKDQRDTALADLRPTDPSRHAEHIARIHALAKPADDWCAHDIRRPEAIDDERLRALVEHPPVPPAQLLGELLSLCFFDWLRCSFSAVTQACIDDPPEQGLMALDGMLSSFVDLLERYEARAELSLYALRELLDVAQPNASMHHELSRWGAMLLDYTEALDARLYEHVLDFADRFESLEHRGVLDTWYRLLDCSRLDACLGLLLARATMLDPNNRPTLARGHVDPMATRATGSLAWWCRLTIDVWDDDEEEDYPLGDRLREDEIATFVRDALLDLEGLVPGLREELVRVFPLVAG